MLVILSYLSCTALCPLWVAPNGFGCWTAWAVLGDARWPAHVFRCLWVVLYALGGVRRHLRDLLKAPGSYNRSIWKWYYTREDCYTLVVLLYLHIFFCMNTLAVQGGKKEKKKWF